MLLSELAVVVCGVVSSTLLFRKIVQKILKFRRAIDYEIFNNASLVLQGKFSIKDPMV